MTSRSSSGAGTTAPSRQERRALCELFRAVGPDAPTLDEGWATRHLAAHLVVREHNPFAAAGIVVRPLNGLHDRAIESALRRHTYEELVGRVAAGPPPWVRPLDPAVNLTEFVVHHEDVRRGADGWEPRSEAATEHVDAAVWRALRRSGRLLARRLHGLALELRLPPDAVPGVAAGSRRPIRLGQHARPLVVAEGRPIELLLLMTGRQRAARVRYDGPTDAVSALANARLGL